MAAAAAGRPGLLDRAGQARFGIPAPLRHPRALLRPAHPSSPAIRPIRPDAVRNATSRAAIMTPSSSEPTASSRPADAARLLSDRRRRRGHVGPLRTTLDESFPSLY